MSVWHSLGCQHHLVSPVHSSRPTEARTQQSYQIAGDADKQRGAYHVQDPQLTGANR